MVISDPDTGSGIAHCSEREHCDSSTSMRGSVDVKF
jgi:hypothetical protein